jgi:hypothetical protein
MDNIGSTRHPHAVPACPCDPVTVDEAALILGCTRSVVMLHVSAGRLPSTDLVVGTVAADEGVDHQLSRADVEALALQVYRWREHRDDVDPYWVTGTRAASILGVNVARLNQLTIRGCLPYETSPPGRGSIPSRAAAGRGARSERSVGPVLRTTLPLRMGYPPSSVGGALPVSAAAKEGNPIAHEARQLRYRASSRRGRRRRVYAVGRRNGLCRHER